VNFEFATAGRIVFGRGALKQAGTLASSFGKKALVVTGQNQKRATGLLESLRSAHVGSSLFTFSGEPSVHTVEAGTAFARQHECDLLIGFGGGSALDAAKGIAAMLTNRGAILDYLEIIGKGQPLENAPAPCIAIPTTAGTGSEVTRNAVLASDQKVKVSLRSPLMLPKVALVDPELTFDLPPHLTASTGLDALTQLIEAYVCARHNPMVDALCLEGIERAARSLVVAYSEGLNAAAREDMAIASLFSGIALANAGLGAVHGFAGPIGGMFPAPHGAVCAALLPHVIKSNIRALRQRDPASPALDRYTRIACLVTGQSNAAAEHLTEWVTKVEADLHVKGLVQFGLKPEHAQAVVEKAAKASSMKPNPITLTQEELLEIYQRAL